MAQLGLQPRYGMLLGMSLIVVSLAANAWVVRWSGAPGW
jgi:hypothetical protein